LTPIQLLIRFLYEILMFMNTTESLPESAVTTSPHPPAGTAEPENGGANLGRWALMLCFILGLALVVGLVPRLRHRHVLARETQELAVSTVNVVSPARGKASATLSLSAEVKPVVEAPIYARASGYLKQWKVDIGATVEAGQLLADIDAPELNQQIAGAKADLAQAQAALALARITAARWAELLKTSSVSEQEAAEKQADLALKTATVDAASANVRRLQELESFTHVIAPFAGTITARTSDLGDLISPGKELFRLADTHVLRVFVRVPQPATPGISVGVDAAMAVPELPSRKFAAKVVRTAGAIDPISRTLLTELEVDNSKHELLAGSYAEVSFADVNPDMALVLPSNTLLFRSEGTQVGVVGADGKVELRNVILGRDLGRTLEIVSGIKSTDRVIINPSDSLVSGTTVRISGG
jgi:membrane fusion protein (multidrug efflux system)